MMPLIRGQAEKIRTETFGEVTYHAAYEPMRTVRTSRWSYIRRFDNWGRAVMPNCDAGPSKEVWWDQGWAQRPLAGEELYDLVFDPNEVNNLADDPKYLDVLRDMRHRLDAWMQQTDDPLLSGPVAPPPGAVVSPQDDRDPEDVRHRAASPPSHD